VTKTKVALIVGAGFSTEASLPTTPELSEGFLVAPPPDHRDGLDWQLRIEIDNTISSELTRFWTTVFHHRPGLEPPSLEDHFTLIDLAANTGHQLGIDYTPRKIRAIRRFSIHRAFQILDSSFKRTDVIGQLLRELKQETTLSLICINWDIVLEKHLHEIQVGFNYGTVVEPLESFDHFSKAGAVKLLKLHGSTNWVYCDSCRRLFASVLEEGKSALHRSVFLEADDFELMGFKEPAAAIRLAGNAGRVCPKCHATLTARVGTFSYRKDYAIQQFQTIWQQAHAALRDSSVWLFAGYSMPEADFEFRHLLKSAELSGETPETKRVEVILKSDADAGSRFKKFFGIPHEQIHQDGLARWAAESFDGWLAQGKKRTNARSIRNQHV
jgi:hypothetical protein